MALRCLYYRYKHITVEQSYGMEDRFQFFSRNSILVRHLKIHYSPEYSLIIINHVSITYNKTQ